MREVGAEARWTVLTPVTPDGGAAAELAVQHSETPVQEYRRACIDLFVGDAAEQAAEVDRLVSLGTERTD